MQTKEVNTIQSSGWGIVNILQDVTERWTLNIV